MTILMVLAENRPQAIGLSLFGDGSVLGCSELANEVNLETGAPLGERPWGRPY